MPKSQHFHIHVDPSCLTDTTDLMMQGKRHDSDQTVIHHGKSEESDVEGHGHEQQEQNDADEESDAEHEGSLIGSHGDQSELSSRLSDGQSHLSSLVSTDSHTDALIHAAARAVVASMEEEGYGQEDSVLSSRTEDEHHGHEDSSLSARTDESREEGDAEGTEMTYDGTETTDEGTIHTYDSEAEYNDDGDDESASSHQDGDDVFSHDNQHSNRSSLNSLSDPQTDDDAHPAQGELHLETSAHHDADIVGHEPTSRVPSTASNAYSSIPSPLTITTPTFDRSHTPSKSRPPFRTPSSVRAIQMSSPTPSIFSGSPRSSKRPNPTVSRLGTPQHSPSKNKTPTRFKAKKEYPLVLLHVTVLPPHWTYAPLMESADHTHEWSRDALAVCQSWRLVQEKLGSMVLERGILLPHPQDDVEVLEERLLDALELPVRPRAKILSCGHYLGPDDEGDSSASSDDEDVEDQGQRAHDADRARWCDICGREVRYENFSLAAKQKRFSVKVYASNGLMRAGAWSAAWREMERVDVEIEPFVPGHVFAELDSLLASMGESEKTERAGEDQQQVVEEYAEHDAEVEHEPISETYMHHPTEEIPPEPQVTHEDVKRTSEDQSRVRREAEEERLREIYGTSPSSRTATPPPRAYAPEAQPQHYETQSQYHRPEVNPVPPRYRQYDQNDSLATLLLAAVKVAMRDRKNILICVLSALVLLLAMRPGSSPVPPPSSFSVPPTHFPVVRQDRADVSPATDYGKMLAADAALHAPPVLRNDALGNADEKEVAGSPQAATYAPQVDKLEVIVHEAGTKLAPTSSRNIEAAETALSRDLPPTTPQSKTGPNEPQTPAKDTKPSLLESESSGEHVNGVRPAPALMKGPIQLSMEGQPGQQGQSRGAEEEVFAEVT
ncbi:MAG: hypothetical protein M1818_006534 [Claussenomyces sp. TS43310]|nr:MAG: hypothetical protein M1818_006534 [Claussenomyces sp. TS43310]